jgi:hypothetical protein
MNFRTEKIGKLELSLDHWDCNCPSDYINAVAEKTYCMTCDTRYGDTNAPNSELNEVLVNLAIKQIKEDVYREDYTAIAELISFVPKDILQSFLSE